MSDQATLERPATGHADDEGAKRRQIVDGARAMFLAQGFDAASMNDIARAAGVSKGTLYVYFKNKEELFEAIVEQECEAQAEGIFDLDPNDHDVEAVLTRAWHCLRQIPLPAGEGLGDPHCDRHCRSHAGARRQILRNWPGQRDCKTRRLYRGPGCGRRTGGRGLRNRGRAAHGSLPGDDIQIDGVQFRFSAKPRADRARGADRDQDVPRRLPRADKGLAYFECGTETVELCAGLRDIEYFICAELPCQKKL